jgi:hypothetical protein
MELINYRLSQELKLKNGQVFGVGTRATITFEGVMVVLHFNESVSAKIKASRLPFYFEDNFDQPDEETLEDWVYEGLCETVTGYPCEPDGFGEDGSPSWLLALGLI